ncbi:MAG TPA: polyhydroxyalkanoate synthesis repressor PhaR [Acidisphaera sp.]|nr:polyhydroxyalkanoate synthesis repressor PhaR [Acidisphaera sp.]
MSETAPAATPAAASPPVVVKKYANRRLYNTESSSYITLDTLADMVRHGRDFVVYDAKTGDDITRSVLTQIIVEEEGKGPAMLPTAFLRQLIGFYGDSLQNLVPRYLEHAMAAFGRQQENIRRTMEKTVGSFFPFEEVGRQNMAMLERAMNLFTPFYRPPDKDDESASPEVQALRHEVEALRAELDRLRATPAAEPAPQPASAESGPEPPPPPAA